MKPFVTSLWRSVLAKRAQTFRLWRAEAAVSAYGQVLLEPQPCGEILGVLIPFRGQKVVTDRLTEDVGDALLFTEAELLVGDVVEGDGERWEVLRMVYWPDQGLHVGEVRRVRGA